LSVIPVPKTIPENLQNANCPGLPVGAPAPTLYFTSEVNYVKESFRNSFGKESFLQNIFIDHEKLESNITVSETETYNYSYLLYFIIVAIVGYLIYLQYQKYRN
jgi:hypothetical protein